MSLLNIPLGLAQKIERILRGLLCSGVGSTRTDDFICLEACGKMEV